MSRTRLLLILAGLLLLYPLFALPRYVTTKTYDVDEAYKVYSAILPTIGERPLVIGAETRTPEICLQPLDAQSEKVLRPAIDNYLELNAVPWQLQKHFDINRHYDLLAEEELKATFQNGMKPPKTYNFPFAVAPNISSCGSGNGAMVSHFPAN